MPVIPAPPPKIAFDDWDMWSQQQSVAEYEWVPLITNTKDNVSQIG